MAVRNHSEKEAPVQSKDRIFFFRVFIIAICSLIFIVQATGAYLLIPVFENIEQYLAW